MQKQLDAIGEDLEACKTEVGQQMEKISGDVAAFRDEMTELKESVAQLLDIFKAGKGALKVMGWIGVTFKWVATIGAGVAALWYLLSGNK